MCTTKMDYYHQTTPPTRLKSEVLGAAGSRKGGDAVTAPTHENQPIVVWDGALTDAELRAIRDSNPLITIVHMVERPRRDAGMGECDAPLDFARVQQALEGGGR